MIGEVDYSFNQFGYVFLDEITETRTCCGFRENMIREANRPFDEVDF